MGILPKLTNKEVNESGTFFRFLIKEAKHREPNNASAVRNASFGYEWYKLGFFTNWHSSGKIVAFCFNLPLPLKDAITQSLKATRVDSALTDPFVLHTVVIEHVVALFDEALWHCRDVVRNIEKVRGQHSISVSENQHHNQSRPTNFPQPDYISMHEIGRHAIHSSETLEMAAAIVQSMIDDHELFVKENLPQDVGPIVSARQIRRSLQYQSTILKCLHLRSKAIEGRLRNEINLVISDHPPLDVEKATNCRNRHSM